MLRHLPSGDPVQQLPYPWSRIPWTQNSLGYAAHYFVIFAIVAAVTGSGLFCRYFFFFFFFGFRFGLVVGLLNLEGIVLKGVAVEFLNHLIRYFLGLDGDKAKPPGTCQFCDR